MPYQGVTFAQDMTETYRQNRRLGYARVNTYGQTLDTQLEQLVSRKLLGASPGSPERGHASVAVRATLK
jgi:hypothetical protein